MNKYKNYWDFLKKTPKNLTSIIIIWAMCIAGLIVVASDPTFDPPWTQEASIGFLVVIMGLAYYRPYTIYKRFKK